MARNDHHGAGDDGIFRNLSDCDEVELLPRNTCKPPRTQSGHLAPETPI